LSDCLGKFHRLLRLTLQMMIGYPGRYPLKLLTKFLSYMWWIGRANGIFTRRGSF
jgi:hypothetical protein